MENTIEISGYVPGAIGRIVELHGTYYSAQWSLGPQFEAEVAAEMGAFLAKFDPAREGFWVALSGGQVRGGIAIASDSMGTRLRWFIVDPACAGAGIGRILMKTALEFCRERGLLPIHLWTMGGLDAARHLYESSGFRLVAEYMDDVWGTAVRHQSFRLDA